MRWDTVERDLVILARDFRAVASSLTSLGAQLRKERLNGSLSITRGDAPAAAKNEGRVPAEQDLAFSPLEHREGPFE